MITQEAKITQSEKLTEGIYSLWLETDIAALSRPGQFVGVYTAQKSNLLQRPISICSISEDKKQLRLVFRVAGKGTDEFSKCQTGDTLRLLGPCGNGYDIGALKGTTMLVGGGIGVPPMVELGSALKAAGKELFYVIGYRNSDLFLYEELCSIAGRDNVHIATDDGSLGTRGTVADAIKEKRLIADAICACGPLPMLRALKGIAGEAGIPAYISLEERMACGVGACLGCVCKTAKKDSHSLVNNARVCVEGPVFEAGDVEI